MKNVSKRLLRPAIAGLAMTLLYGCSIIQHKDQLLAMADFSRDKNVQHVAVTEIDAKYDALSAVINNGKIKNYPNHKAILQNFGQPIAKEVVTIAGYKQEKWLYRHAIPQKANDKVYLYFDPKGKLINYTQEQIRWK